MDIISLKEDGTARVSAENWNSPLHLSQAASTPAHIHSIKCACVCECVSVAVWVHECVPECERATASTGSVFSLIHQPVRPH